MAKTRPRYKTGPKKGKFMSNRAIAAQRAAKKKKRSKGTKKRSNKSGAKKRSAKGSTMAKGKKKGGRRRSTKGKGLSTPRRKAEIAGAGMAFGYVEQMPNSMLANIPQIQALGFDGTMAIGLHFAAKAAGRGTLAKILDRGAEAYAGSFGLEFGRNGLKLSGDQLGHDGRPVRMAGSVRYDEAADAIEHGQ